MSEQFKVGDVFRITAAAYATTSFGMFPDVEYTVTGIDGDRVLFENPANGVETALHTDWVRLATPSDLKARRALLVSEISEIDKQIEAEAQGDGLSRLKAIVGETGYFREGNSFYRYPYLEAGGITETDIVGHYDIAVSEGYGFSALGAGDVEASRTNVCCCFPSDLEGWQSITMERFLRAKSDYESIVQMVKEAMEP